MKTSRALFACALLAHLPHALAQGFLPLSPVSSTSPSWPAAPAALPMPQYNPYVYPAPYGYAPPPAYAPLPPSPYAGVGATPVFLPAPAVTPSAPAFAVEAQAPAAPAHVNPWLQNVPQTPSPAASTSAATPSAPGSTNPNPWLQNVPISAFQRMLTPQAQSTRPYTMRRIISQEEKKQLMQTMLPMLTGFMNMDMADAMNYFAHKYKAKPGLTFDEVRDSLLLRANMVNMKKVGENLMWKDFHAVLGDYDAPRIEVYSFCDIAVGRELLKISPEFVVFLPCRIAIMEDGNKDIWVLMLDWNVDWVEGFKDRLKISDALWQGARDIRDRLDNMMQAAANGDL